MHTHPVIIERDAEGRLVSRRPAQPVEVELTHRSPTTDAMHYGTRFDCTLSACIGVECESDEDARRLHMAESPYLG